MVTQNSWNSEDPAQVAKGGTGLSSTTAYAVICGGTTATADLQNIASIGTSGQILTSNGVGALPTFQAAAGGGGVLAQTDYTMSNTASSTATNIPNDDTIPQITEGAEFITLSYTPLAAANILEIEFVGYISRLSGATSITVALFVDATANAICSTNSEVPTNPTNAVVAVVLRYRVSAASTSARTYRIRYGSNTSTAYINQSNDGSNHGNNLYSTLTVKEFS